MNPIRPKRAYVTLADFEEMLFDVPEGEKWELIGRRVFRGMVGATISHQIVVHNVSFRLSSELRRRKTGCRVFSGSLHLKDASLDLAALPDLMVRCGKIDEDLLSISDPVVIVEVASPASVNRDASEKYERYMRLASLQHDVLIWRDTRLVRLFSRVGDSFRAEQDLTKPDDVLSLPAIDVGISLADIYENVPPPRNSRLESP